MNLGTLAVSMVANIKNFTQGMARAQKDAAKTGNVLRAVFPKTSKYFDGISESLSIANSAMTKFTNNADLAAQATDGIGLAITKAATDESLRKIFKDLNVDIGKLSKAEPEKQLLMMSDAFRKLKDPTKQAAMSMQLFGKNTAVANAFIGPKGMAKYLPLLKLAFISLIPVVMGATAMFTKFIINGAQRGAEALDKLAKSASNVGMNIRNMAALQFGVQLSGGSQEEAEQAVRKMNEVIGKALEGDTGAQKSLSSIGISAEQLVGLGATERLAVLNKALHGIRDSALRGAAATRIFGESNKGITGLMRDSASAMDDTRQKTDRLFITYDKMAEHAAGVEQLRDAWATMQAQMESLWKNISGELSPSLAVAVSLASDFLTLIKYQAWFLGKVGDGLERILLLYAEISKWGGGGIVGIAMADKIEERINSINAAIAKRREELERDQIASAEEIAAAQERADEKRKEREEEYRKLIEKRIELEREWREAGEDSAMDRAEKENDARNQRAGVLTSTGYMSLAGMAGTRGPDRQALNEQRKANKILQEIAKNTKSINELGVLA